MAFDNPLDKFHDFFLNNLIIRMRLIIHSLCSECSKLNNSLKKNDIAELIPLKYT